MALRLFAHLAEVESEIGAAAHLLLCLDFDGTLAPIVPRPDDARMPDETRALLETLAARLDITIAIVSGRSLDDLSSRIGLNVILAANHGLQISGQGLLYCHPQAEERRHILHRMSGSIARNSAEIPGILVEDKGQTATVHFRNAADSGRDRIISIVQAVFQPESDRFELREGKKVLEIVPRVSWDKGSAVVWIEERIGEKLGQAMTVCYMGDDTTDENAFRAPGGITIRVGEEEPTAARFTVRDTAEAARFLRWLSEPNRKFLTPAK